MGDLPDFGRGQIVVARSAGPSVFKTVTLLRATVSKVMSTYTNHGKTASGKRNSRRKSTLIERDRRILRRTVSKNHTITAAQVTAELNLHLEVSFSTKTVRRELHKFNIHGRVAIAKPLITESNAQMRKQWCPVMTIKPGHQTTGNARVIWSDELSFTLFHTSGRAYFWRRLKDAWFGSNSETREIFYESLDNKIVVQHSVCPIITLHGRITVREYVGRLGNQGHPMIQMLFPNNDAVFQDDNAHIHTAGTVQSWFEDREGEHQHVPWPTKSPDLNIIEPL
jgi:hypothetical protein